jgi:hypothetical protein
MGAHQLLMVVSGEVDITVAQVNMVCSRLTAVGSDTSWLCGGGGGGGTVVCLLRSDKAFVNHKDRRAMCERAHVCLNGVHTPHAVERRALAWLQTTFVGDATPQHALCSDTCLSDDAWRGALRTLSTDDRVEVLLRCHRCPRHGLDVVSECSACTHVPPRSGMCAPKATDEPFYAQFAKECSKHKLTG